MLASPLTKMISQTALNARSFAAAAIARWSAVGCATRVAKRDHVSLGHRRNEEGLRRVGLTERNGQVL